MKHRSRLILKHYNLSHTVRRLLDSYVSVSYVLIAVVLMAAARMHTFQGNGDKRREKEKSSSNKFRSK